MHAESSRRMRSTHSGSGRHASLISPSGSGRADSAAASPVSSAPAATSRPATAAETLSPRNHTGTSTHTPSAQHSQPQSPRSTSASSELQRQYTPRSSAPSNEQRGADRTEKLTSNGSSLPASSPRPQPPGSLGSASVLEAECESGRDRLPASNGNRVSKGLSLLTRRLKRANG